MLATADLPENGYHFQSCLTELARAYRLKRERAAHSLIKGVLKMNTVALKKQAATISLEKFIKACPVKAEFFSVNGNLNTAWTGITTMSACFHDSGLPDGIFKRDTALRAMVAPPDPDYRYSDNLTPILPLSGTIQLPADALFDLLPFAGLQDVRYYLNGVYVTPEDGGKLVATNGHVLRAVSFAEAAALPAPVIIPRELVELAHKCKAESISVMGEVGNRGAAEFFAGQVHAQARGIDGRFPDYKRIIPNIDSRPFFLTLPNPKQATTWMKAAKLLCGNKFPNIGISKGNFVSVNDGVTIIHGPASTPVEIFFMSEYFGLLCQFANGQPLRIVDDNSSAVIFDNDDVTIVMPMRV